MIKVQKTKTTKKRAPSKKEPIKKETPAPKQEGERYFAAIGRRKTSSARVRLLTGGGSKEILVNDKPYQAYFPSAELQYIIVSPLDVMNVENFQISVKVKGGGLHSQAEAIRHGIARALVLFNKDFRKRLKKAGYLTRDSRMRERKKFGLKRARRAPQWRKR